VAEQIKVMFRVNTPRGTGTWNIVLDVGPDPPTERGAVLNFGTLHIFGTAEARDLKFCVGTE